MSVTATVTLSEDRLSAVTRAAAGRVAVAGVRLLLVAVILVPVYGSLTIEGSLAARLAIGGLFCISLIRPEDGLLLCAGFLPVAGAVAGVLGFPASLVEPFVLAFLAGWLLGDTVRAPAPIDGATRALIVPALLFAAAAAASMLVQLIVQQAFEDYPWRFVTRVITHLAGAYLIGDSYPGLAPGALILESVGLFTATLALSRRRRELARQLLAMATVGAAGVAAVNLYRFAEICLRSPGTFEALLLHPRSIRISLAFADVNAAGSYLGMMLLVAGGLVVAARRWAWGPVTLMVAGALGLSGSRTAWAAVVLSGMVALALTRRQRKHARLLIIAPVALAFVFVVASLLMPTGRSEPKEEMSRALVSRYTLGWAGLRMLWSHPVVGVGVGRFLTESARYLDPSFAHVYYPKENAHNNFLQILAELGSTGFVLFVWILLAVGRHLRVRWRGSQDVVLGGTVAGLVAFLLSCLAGHPLLVPEVAMAFWLLLGVAAALVSTAASAGADGAQSADRPRRDIPGVRREWLLAAAVVCLVVSVPVRANLLLKHETDLRQAAIGFSASKLDPTGVKYRSMAGKAQFYAPASQCWIRLGVRVEPPGKATDKASAVDVELRVDGRVVDRMRALSDTWKQFRLAFHAGSRPGFRKIELRTASDATAHLFVSGPDFSDCGHGSF